MMTNKFVVLLVCLMLLPATGCVMKSTYDTVIQEGETAKAELDRTRDEQKQLARQVSQIERLNAEAMQETELARAAVQRAQDDAERRRQLMEDHIARLKQKVTQLAKQHTAVQYDLTVAKENTAALQELVEVYQKKVRDGSVAGMATSAEVPAAKPFDPSTIPMPQELPSPTPSVEPSKPRATTTPDTPPASPKPASEPKESGWFSEIKQWILSLWRSVFS